MSNRADIILLKERANERMGEVLARLGLDVKRGSIVMCDPMSEDRNPSLAIWLNKPGGLSWKRYGRDAQGDIVNLVAYLNGWWWSPDRGFRDAVKWLKDALGPNPPTETERRQSRERAALVAEQDAEDQARFQRWARGLFFGASTRFKHTAAETYLRERRGIDLALFPRGPRGGDRQPGFLRFLPSHRHRGEDGRETAWPCLVACCVDGAGIVRAVHRTWLRHDGSDKAPVRPPRKVFPALRGLVIPVWKGDTNMTIRAAIDAGLRETLCITEGWEDGLAWALACPERRVWAALSISNIGNIRLPECIDSVLLHRQNDKFSVTQEFLRQKAELERQGRPVGEVKAFFGKDLSDTLRGAA